MKRIYWRRISTIGALCITMGMHADAYNDRLVRIINTISNQYDRSSRDAQDMASAALQALNFVTVENSLSKNSPLGKKNKYITICAEKLQEKVLELLKVILDSEKIETGKASRDVLLKKAWFIESKLKQIEGEIAEIPKKQLLPLTKVQKDLINLLELLVRKNITVITGIIPHI